jgi:hypothetical protein
MSSQERNGAPRRGREYWLGWVAAGLVVLIIVAVAIMAWQELAPPAPNRAEIEMTPIVGGMALVTATPTAAGATGPAATPTAVVITVTIDITDDTTPTIALAEIPAVEVAATITTPAVTVETVAPPTPPPAPTATATLTATVAPPVAATVAPAESAEPEATAVPTATRPPTPAPSLTPTPVAATRIVFAPDDQVVGLEGRLTVFAQASADAPVLDSVGAGVPLTVLEPGGDYTSYPVIIDGHGWVRVRAADGLVGWVMTDTLVLQP